MRRTSGLQSWLPGNRFPAPQQLTGGCAVIVLAVFGGIILVLLAVAGWCDYRARARGTRFRLTGKDAYQNRGGRPDARRPDAWRQPARRGGPEQTRPEAVDSVVA